MSRSFGAGSPVWFKCPFARSKARRSSIHTDGGRNYQLTGRRLAKRCAGAVGLRSDSLFVYEFKCLDCGHVGWSRHVTLARRFKREFPECAPPSVP
jgi:hypothetical protein